MKKNPEIEVATFQPDPEHPLLNTYPITPDGAIYTDGGMFISPTTWTAKLYSGDIVVTVVQVFEQVREEDITINNEVLNGEVLKTTKRQIADRINTYLD